MTKAAIIFVGVLSALPAMAGSITFTISDTATGSFTGGSLNGDTFTGALVTFTQVTDTSAISTAICGYPCAPSVNTNTVTIAGLSTVTLTGNTYFFDNAINVVGITNAPGSAYLAAEANSLGAYTMTTAFASTSFPIYGGSAVVSLATSGGSMTVTSFGQSATFAACTQCSVSPTPEPGSLGLLLAAAIPLAAGLLRRRRRAMAGN